GTAAHDTLVRVSRSSRIASYFRVLGVRGGFARGELRRADGRAENVSTGFPEAVRRHPAGTPAAGPGSEPRAARLPRHDAGPRRTVPTPARVPTRGGCPGPP